MSIGARVARAALVLAALSGCAEDDYARLFHTRPVAPSYTQEQIATLQTLGPTFTDQGVNFSVYSANAERVDLLIFLDPEAERPDQRFEMKRIGDVWNLYVEGVGRGTHYGYVAWGPNWTFQDSWYPGAIDGFEADVDKQGNRFNPNKLLTDPYAKVFHRDHDWARASLGTGPDRTQSTWGAGSKSVVWSPTYTWSKSEREWIAARKEGRPPFHDWNELVVYEVHPKGFTADAASGVLHPGTWQGIGEMAPYLADLGITVVELLPIHEKPLDGGYWGYNNISFFMPEISYTSGCTTNQRAPTCDPLEVIAEFKEMVDQLHQHGIEVMVDVVYNHTGEGGLWRERIYQDDVSLGGTGDGFYNLDPSEVASLYNLRGIDNASYYVLPPDGQTYWNNTGVGNQVRANHEPARRLIVDSLRFLVEELHVDGFRFDLAPVLGEADDAYNVWAPEGSVVEDIANDPVLIEHHTRIIAEPWSVCPGCGFQLGQFLKSEVDPEAGWGEWNAYYRDWWREFVNYDDRALNSRVNGDGWAADGGHALTGSYNLFGDDGRLPYHSVNMITVHDGFTLYDLVTYEEKVNGCGPLNPVCCEDPTSAWCQQDSGDDHNRSRNWGDEATKRQMMRNFFAALMISHGTPLILGGDEYMRTQLGNNNAYSTGADNPFNWHAWGAWYQNDDKTRMHDFVRQMIRVRREHLELFAPKDWTAEQIVRWRSASGGDDVNWSGRHVRIDYLDSEGQVGAVVLLNMERYPVGFSLPQGAWGRVIDTQRWFDDDSADNPDDFFDQTGADTRRSWNATLDDAEVVSGSYEAQGSSIVVFLPGDAG